MICKNCEKSTSGFCNEHKPSELFEGENSSLRKTFEKATGYIGKVELIEKIREDIKKEILEEVEKITTKTPERESDEYDKGQEDFKIKVEDIIKGI